MAVAQAYQNGLMLLKLNQVAATDEMTARVGVTPQGYLVVAPSTDKVAIAEITASGGELTSSMSAAQIYAAVQDGKIVVATYASKMYTLYSATLSSATFSATTIANESTRHTERINVIGTSAFLTTKDDEGGGGGDVSSVNGKTGAVVLIASDVGAYEKPATGIPLQDLKSDVVASLGKADTAYQKPSGGVPESDLATAVKDKLTTANPSGTASTVLSKLKIGNVIYEMPQGGEGSKTVVTVNGTTPSMSTYDIYRAALSGVVEILVDGFRLPLKYADGSLAAFAGVIESDDGPALLEVVIDTDAELTSKILYEVPSGGIPQADLASAVRTSLGKADTAYQKPSGGIPLSDISADAKNALKRNAITLEPFLSSQTQYTMSISMSDIYAAYQAGKDVFIEYEDPYTYEKVDCRLIRIDGVDSAVFAGCKISNNAVTAILFTAMNNLAEKSEIAIGGASTASDVTVADSGGYFTADTVEGALSEIGAQLDGLEGVLYGIAEDLEDTL